MSKSKDDICPVSLSDDSDCLIIDEDRCFEDPGDYVVAASGEIHAVATLAVSANTP